MHPLLWLAAAHAADPDYDAQPFPRNRHLGSDWNGNGKGNTDLGDPVFAAVVAHRVDGLCVETLYAHLDRIEVAAGEIVVRGAGLGTIGTAHGRYWAHLHFEIRDRAGLPLGVGYGEAAGNVDPTAFIRARRP